MKIEKFDQTLARVKPCVSNRSTLEVLRSVRFVSDTTGLLWLEANMLERACRIPLDVKDDDTFLLDGLIVKHKTLLQGIKALKCNPLELTGEWPDGSRNARSLHAYGCNGTLRIKALDENRGALGQWSLLVDWCDTPKERMAKMTVGDIRNVVRYILPASATDHSRPILGSVRCEFNTRFADFAATDGYRLTAMNVHSAHAVTEAWDVVIPPDAWKALWALYRGRDADEVVGVYHVKNEQHEHVVFIANDATMFQTQVVPGNYPDWRFIVAKTTSPATVRVPRKDLANGARYMHMCRPSSQTALWSANMRISDKGELVFFAESFSERRSHEYNAQVDSFANGVGVETRFAVRQLTDAANAMTGESVVLHWPDSDERPMRWESISEKRGMTAVIMPMRPH